MPSITRRALAFIVLVNVTFLAPSLSTHAQPAASPMVRLRGTVETAGEAGMRIRLRSGEALDLLLGERLAISEVHPITLADVRPGSFIGTAALPQPDGTLRAIAITVFPESARGAGEGHRPFDLTPESTMTNATVADEAAVGADRRLVLTYRGGQQTLVVPPDAPVVSFRPGGRDLLVPGASVSLSAQEINGKPTALRINAGRNGFQLPY